MTDVAAHLRALADEIGPRPATTDTEEQAAAYIEACFENRGLETDRQEVMAPRTYSWAYVIYHVLTIAAAIAVNWYPWPAAVVALLVAILMWLDLDTRWGLSSLMPKGPTQNVIGRKPANTRRGETVRRIVIVAHYDSARSSLAFHPAMVKNVYLSVQLMLASTILVAGLSILAALEVGFLEGLEPSLWYGTMAAAAYLVFPLVINVHRELFMPFVDGANDNASGVAAMLGVLEHAVPEEVVPSDTRAMRVVAEAEAAAVARRISLDADTAPHPVVHGAEALADADVVPEGAVLQYAPAGPLDDSFADAFASDAESGFGDVEWQETEVHEDQGTLDVGEPAETRESVDTGSWLEGEDAWDSPFVTGPPAASEPIAAEAAAPDTYGAPIEMDGPIERRVTGEFDRVREERGEAPSDDTAPHRAIQPDDASGVSVFDDPDVVEADEPEEDYPEERPRRRWFSRRRKEAGAGEWLGVDGDFDVRDEGRRIGTWDNIDDDSGSKGGAAGLCDLDDPGFAESEAARIRRRVTTRVDRGLDEKEIWFVATGAEETGTWGMRAFLDYYAEDLKDAVIINIDNVGAGNLAWVTKEGMARLLTSDRRLQSAARRVARENEWRIKGTEYRGLSTDATPALVRGFRAISIMGFDINGRLPNWHWRTDTTSNVTVETVERAAEYVAQIARSV